PHNSGRGEDSPRARKNRPEAPRFRAIIPAPRPNPLQAARVDGLEAICAPFAEKSMNREMSTAEWITAAIHDKAYQRMHLNYQRELEARDKRIAALEAKDAAAKNDPYLRERPAATDLRAGLLGDLTPADVEDVVKFAERQGLRYSTAKDFEAVVQKWRGSKASR